MVGGYDLQRFLGDEMAKRAVSMSLIKIGESVKLLSKEIKQENQDIAWRDIAALRNIAAHNYEGLRMDDVWEIVTKDVPELLEQVKGILHAEK